MSDSVTTALALTKTCIRCGTEKPLDAFAVKNRRTGRRRGCCEQCRRAGFQRRRSERLAPVRELKQLAKRDATISRRMALTDRTCVRCGVCKPISRFRWKCKSEWLREYACRTCVERAWRLRHPEKHADRRRARRRRLSPGKRLWLELRRARNKSDIRRWREVFYEHHGRQCRTCGTLKPRTCFGVENPETGRLRGVCNACSAEQVKQYSATHPEASAAAKKRWTTENADRLKSQRQEYNRRPEIRKRSTEQARQWRRANVFKVKAVAHRYRVRKRSNAPVERFTDIEIFKRDGWVCQICGKRVDRLLRYPDPKSPSLDHVIPVSKGGGHVRANCQLAHLCCNVRKRDLQTTLF